MWIVISDFRSTNFAKFWSNRKNSNIRSTGLLLVYFWSLFEKLIKVKQQTTHKQTHNDWNSKLIMINLQREDVEWFDSLILLFFLTARPTPAPKPHLVKGINKTCILFIILGSRKTKRFHFNRQWTFTNALKPIIPSVLCMGPDRWPGIVHWQERLKFGL